MKRKRMKKKSQVQLAYEISYIRRAEICSWIGWVERRREEEKINRKENREYVIERVKMKRREKKNDEIRRKQ